MVNTCSRATLIGRGLDYLFFPLGIQRWIIHRWKNVLHSIFIQERTKSSAHTFYVVVRALKPLTVVSPQTSLYRQGNIQTIAIAEWSAKFCGGFGERETPVPIPNTAVKPLSADDTARATLWESRSPPHSLSSEPYFEPPGSKCGELIPSAGQVPRELSERSVDCTLTTE